VSRLLQVFRTGFLTVAWLLVASCLFILFSAVFPVIPFARIYATGIVPNYAPWLFLWALVGLSAGMLMHAQRKTRATLSLVVAASIAILTAAGVMLHLLYVAESNGARINLVKTLSLRDFGDGAGPDESRIYSRPQGEALWLDVYHPHKRPPGQLSPVLFVIHGGGFAEGSRTFGATNMRWYADRGWTVIAVDYRLARAGRPTWNLATRDIECALAWTEVNASGLGIDITRLTLSGGSAGGTLAMAAAYATDAARVDPSCGPHVPKVAAVMVKVPLIDAVGSWNQHDELRDVQRSILTRYLGGSPEQYPARYAAADPRRYLGPDIPPTLILGGADDPLVPPAGALDFARGANASGANVRHILFPYSGHDFNTTFGSITNQAVLQICARFMIDHPRVLPGPLPSSGLR
jgi:acetyl esterase